LLYALPTRFDTPSLRKELHMKRTLQKLTIAASAGALALSGVACQMEDGDGLDPGMEDPLMDDGMTDDGLGEDGFGDDTVEDDGLGEDDGLEDDGLGEDDGEDF
jgi:hypothetical protein